MEMIFEMLHGGLSSVIPLVILLGLLIFVHELGHFLVAKFFGVRVEVFSLGFGKKLLQFKRGDTVYCISMIPLGGYVKMYGDEIGADIPEEEKRYAFTHKPVSQRFAVVLAGPLMNFFFALFLFMVIPLVGEQVIAPRLGDVEGATMAYEAGFRSGDQILSVNDKLVETYEDFHGFIETHKGNEIQVKVARENSGEEVLVRATPSESVNDDVLRGAEVVGDISGITYISRSSMIGISDPKSLVGLTGLRTGDLITTIGGTKVQYWRELVPQFSNHLGSEEVSLSIVREIIEDGKSREEPISMTLNLSSIGEEFRGSEKLLGELGIENYDLFLAQVVKDSAAEAGGLKEGDRIVSVGQVAVNGWPEVVKKIENYKKGDPPLSFEIVRGGQPLTVEVVPRLSRVMTSRGVEEDRFMIGIQRPIYEAPPTTKLHRTGSLLDAARKGIVETQEMTYLTIMSYVRLFQAKVSAKNIGGVITIGQMASQTFKMGLSPFLKIMAVISVNLFILNLLPVPILDGGHLVFYSIEVLRGAPLSMRKLEIAQQIGLILILALIVFTIFNDFARLLNISW